MIGLLVNQECKKRCIENYKVIPINYVSKDGERKIDLPKDSFAVITKVHFIDSPPLAVISISSPQNSNYVTCPGLNTPVDYVSVHTSHIDIETTDLSSLIIHYLLVIPC